jgi:AcrR family transcriptional regulator
MARNKYPEETKKKILEVAKKLFLEKGYDGTTIQDIVNGLGGMTKGVIYHHFKSKEDIFNRLMAETSGFNGAADSLEDFRSEDIWQGKNGFEKIQNALLRDLRSYEKMKIIHSATIMLNTPRIIGETYLEAFEKLIPAVQNVVEEGIADGSIVTEFPEEIAELFVLTMNLWIAFQLANYSREQALRKFLFQQKIFEGLNFPLINEEVFAALNKFYDQLEQQNK